MSSYHSDMPPDFLGLAEPPTKPRRVGLTHALDKGVSVEAMVGILTSYSAFIDIWKFGWGTSYLEPRLDEKMALLRSHGVQSCVGGTLLEIAWARGRVDECLDWARSAGFDAVEVSRGVVPMPLDEKQGLIRQACADFTVFAETGYKTQERLLLPDEWRREFIEDLASGARYVVAEGRESGTIGVYDRDGRTQEEIVDAAVAAAGIDRCILRRLARTSRCGSSSATAPRSTSAISASSTSSPSPLCGRDFGRTPLICLPGAAPRPSHDRESALASHCAQRRP